MAKTAQQLITRAFLLAGATSSGSAPTSDESDDALVYLNEMLTNWSEQGITIPYRIENQIVLTPGKSEYSFGSGGDINSERPLFVQEAWLEDSSGQSFKFEITMGLREYSRISNKQLPGRPYRAWYEPTYPLGTLRLDNEPDFAYTLHAWTLKQLTEFSTLSTASVLPPAYDRAIRFNLALELSAEFKSPLDPLTLKIAEESFRHIKNANLARTVNKLSVDSALLSPGRYDVRTDGY